MSTYYLLDNVMISFSIYICNVIYLLSLRYKPVIILEALAYLGTWLILLFGTGVGSMQFVQFMYGVATATEIAYFAYIYATVDAAYYQKATSLIRGNTCITYICHTI